MGRGQDKDSTISTDGRLAHTLPDLSFSPLPCLAFDEGGKITSGNDAASNLFSYDIPEISGLYLEDLLLQPYSVNDLVRKKRKDQYLVFRSRPEQLIPVVAQAHAFAGDHLWFIYKRQEPDFQPHISIRERQILDLVTDGASNGEIAHGLGIAQTTVQQHTTSLKQKLKAKTRAHIIERALAHELVYPRSTREVGFVVETRGSSGRKMNNYLAYIDNNTKENHGSIQVGCEAKDLVDVSYFAKVSKRAAAEEKRQYFVDKKIAFAWSNKQVLVEGWVDPLPDNRMIYRLFY
jgi:DNA-binding CsgD family transcriptional regulator